MTQEEQENQLRTKVKGENREYFRAGLTVLVLGTMGAIGAGISYCTKRTDPELQHQYQNCQYFLQQVSGEESKHFVYDDIFVVGGKYKGKTCREIIDLYSARK